MFSLWSFILGAGVVSALVLWFRECLFSDRNYACWKKPSCGAAWPEWPGPQKKK